MKVKVGDIIEVNDERYIILKTKNGNIRKTQPLRKYLESVIVIEYQGEYRTIREVLDAAEIVFDEYSKREEVKNNE